MILQTIGLLLVCSPLHTSPQYNHDVLNYQIGDIFRPNAETPDIVITSAEGTFNTSATTTTTIEENLDGYSEFEGFCRATVIQKRPYSTATVCANHCDANNKCVGFQIRNHQCLLLQNRCQPQDLEKGKTTQSRYFLKDIHCNDPKDCEPPQNCFTPKGFNCTCLNDFCYPHPIERDENFPSYHHYHGGCATPAFDLPVAISKKVPLISLSQCIAECEKEPKCASLLVSQRYCQLNKYVCPADVFQRLPNETLGQDYYVKDIYHNFTCNSNNDCQTSPHSWCTILSLTKQQLDSCCTCDQRSHFCLVQQPPLIVPFQLFYARLKEKDAVRISIPPPAAECTDKHICCPQLFPKPQLCSDADYGICPKSCAQCKSTEKCKDRSPECPGYKDKCDDVDSGPFMKAQCPETCGTCGKSAKSLGITCNECTDKLPNCEDLANDGKCDSVENQCRKSCGCF